MTLDREVVDLLSDDPTLLAVADAVAATGHARPRHRARRSALLTVPVVLVAVALTPISGASLLHRAAVGFGIGSSPAAPAPYAPGDQVWTQNAPEGATITGSAWTPTTNPSAPPAYVPGDQLWTTTPAQSLTTATVDCGSLLDAASALEAAEQAGTSTNAVECR